jgi:hypothetical protein
MITEANATPTVASAPSENLVRIYNKNKSAFGSYTHGPYTIKGTDFASVPQWLADKWTKMFPQHIALASDVGSDAAANNAKVEEQKTKVEELSKENQELADRVKNLEAMLKNMPKAISKNKAA